MGHGTHVAGTVGGKEYGVAKKAEIISIKVFSDITRSARNDDIIKALEWVTSDAKVRGKKGVVNMSLGGAGPNPALNAAVAANVRSGLAVCVAAGNDMASFPSTHPQPLKLTKLPTERHQPTTLALHQSPSQLQWVPWIKQTRFRISRIMEDVFSLYRL
jgi:subtilisin family serine protease